MKMSTIKDKAMNILNEKNNKIIPENIKSGVQVFDVTGTYKGSGVDYIEYALSKSTVDGRNFIDTTLYKNGKYSSVTKREVDVYAREEHWINNLQTSIWFYYPVGSDTLWVYACNNTSYPIVVNIVHDANGEDVENFSISPHSGYSNFLASDFIVSVDYYLSEE